MERFSGQQQVYLSPTFKCFNTLQWVLTLISIWYRESTDWIVGWTLLKIIWLSAAVGWQTNFKDKVWNCARQTHFVHSDSGCFIQNFILISVITNPKLLAKFEISKIAAQLLYGPILVLHLRLYCKGQTGGHKGNHLAKMILNLCCCSTRIMQFSSETFKKILKENL